MTATAVDPAEPTSADEPDELAAALAEVLAATSSGDGGSPSITGLRRLSGGASRESWFFGLAGSHRSFVLRRDPAGAERIGTMSQEASALRAAGAAGAPVPTIVGSGEDFAGTGAGFMITEHVDGEALGPRIVRSEGLSDARRHLADDCGRAIARIHTIDPGSIGTLQHEDQLEFYRNSYRGLERPSVAIEAGLRWLDQHRPPQRQPVVVHGDFRNGNIIVGPEGLRAVLDWELVRIGDPVDDLGWLCVRTWRYGGAGAVGGFGDHDELLDGYAAVAGWRPTMGELRWWELLGTVRWAIACLRAAESFDRGISRTLDTAALARRLCENEHDVLALIEEVGW